jgi:hypothetical protein
MLGTSRIVLWNYAQSFETEAYLITFKKEAHTSENNTSPL